MDRNVWCSECGEYVGLGHRHDDTRGPSLPLIERADIFRAAVDRYVESPYSGDPRTITSEELAEAVDIIREGTLREDSPHYIPTILAAKKYVESNVENIIRAGKKLIKARERIFEDSLLTLHSKSNGDIGVSGQYTGYIKQEDGSHKPRRYYNVDESFGFDIEEDLGAL